MKDPHFRGLNLITYLDDALWCATCARLFKEAPSENVVMILKQAVKKFDTPATMLSDNESCYVGICSKVSKNPRNPQCSRRIFWIGGWN